MHNEMKCKLGLGYKKPLDPCDVMVARIIRQVASHSHHAYAPCAMCVQGKLLSTKAFNWA